MMIFSTHTRPNAKPAPIAPCTRPSAMNGTRTNQFDAPTSFMTSISRRRANVASRIVLTMRNSDDASSDARHRDEREPDPAGDGEQPLDLLRGGDHRLDARLIVVRVRDGRRSAPPASARPGTTRGGTSGVTDLDQRGLVGEVLLEDLVRAACGRGTSKLLTLRVGLQLALDASIYRLSSVAPHLHEDLELDAVLPLLRAVVDGGRDEQDPAEQEQRDRDGDDARDRHQQVAPQRDQRLARRSTARRDISCRRRRRRAPGRARAMPWSSSMTRRRIASTMRWSCVAITTVVPVRLMRSSRRMIPTVVAGSRFPVGSSASRISGRFDERPRDRHPLLLTTGQLGREVVGLLGEADEVEDLRHLRAHDVLRPADHLERERDVLVDRLVRRGA